MPWWTATLRSTAGRPRRRREPSAGWPRRGRQALHLGRTTMRAWGCSSAERSGGLDATVKTMTPPTRYCPSRPPSSPNAAPSGSADAVGHGRIGPGLPPRGGGGGGPTVVRAGPVREGPAVVLIEREDLDAVGGIGLEAHRRATERVGHEADGVEPEVGQGSDAGGPDGGGRGGQSAERGDLLSDGPVGLICGRGPPNGVGQTRGIGRDLLDLLVAERPERREAVGVELHGARRRREPEAGGDGPGRELGGG